MTKDTQTHESLVLDEAAFLAQFASTTESNETAKAQAVHDDLKALLFSTELESLSAIGALTVEEASKLLADYKAGHTNRTTEEVALTLIKTTRASATHKEAVADLRRLAAKLVANAQKLQRDHGVGSEASRDIVAILGDNSILKIAIEASEKVLVLQSALSLLLNELPNPPAAPVTILDAVSQAVEGSLSARKLFLASRAGFVLSERLAAENRALTDKTGELRNKADSAREDGVQSVVKAAAKIGRFVLVVVMPEGPSMIVGAAKRQGNTIKVADLMTTDSLSEALVFSSDVQAAEAAVTIGEAIDATVSPIDHAAKTTLSYLQGAFSEGAPTLTIRELAAI